MVTISSIDLSSNKVMYDAAKESFEERLYTNVIFDALYHTIWVVWDMEEYE